jgi:undecaprenyl-diphosphatase
MLEHYNHLWFAYINAAAGLNGWRFGAAVFLAEWLIWLIPSGLVLLWLLGTRGHRQAAVRACLAAACALIINQVIGLVWFHARPFMEGVGHTFITHAPDSSFPSDHVTLMLTVGLALLASLSALPRRIGCLLIACSPLVAWARIFLGVHYPLDILGAVGVALCTMPLTRAATVRVGTLRLVRVLETVYRRLFAKPIALGWVKR